MVLGLLGGETSTSYIYRMAVYKVWFELFLWVTQCQVMSLTCHVLWCYLCSMICSMTCSWVEFMWVPLVDKQGDSFWVQKLSRNWQIDTWNISSVSKLNKICFVTGHWNLIEQQFWNTDLVFRINGFMFEKYIHVSSFPYVYVI